jgi:probable phosphoglycerate mutase
LPPAELDLTSRILFLARHGETSWNFEGRWQGQSDVGLNARGRVQAAALAARLAGRGITRICSSDLSRARETAEIVARHLGLGGVVAVDPALRERGYGVFEGLTREECETQHPDEWTRYLADRTHTPTGAELQDLVVERMRAAVARAGAQATHADERILIVSHGGAIRALLAAATGERPPMMDNGATFRVRLTTEGFRDVEPLI